MLAFVFCFMVVCTAANRLGKIAVQRQQPINLSSSLDSCQNPGNAICRSVDLPDHQFHPCCPDSNVQCLPWTGDGYVPSADGPDYFCQFVEDIPVGGDCSVSSYS